MPYYMCLIVYTTAIIALVLTIKHKQYDITDDGGQNTHKSHEY